MEKAMAKSMQKSAVRIAKRGSRRFALLCMCSDVTLSVGRNLDICW
jgi:hypothetical protein